MLKFISRGWLFQTAAGLIGSTLFFTPQLPLWAFTSNPTLMLEQAIQEGLERSPVIAQAAAVVAEASWKHTEVLGEGFLPKLTGSGVQYVPGLRYTETTLTGLPGGSAKFFGFFPNTTLGLDLMVPLFDGFANFERLKSADLLWEAAQKDLLRAQFQLRKEIELAFFSVLAAQQLSGVAQETVKSLNEHWNQVKLQNKNGAATTYDVLHVEVQLSDAETERVDGLDNEGITRRKLAEQMGLSEDWRELAGALPIPHPEAIAQIIFSDITPARDDLTALQLRAEAAERLQTAQNSWLVPSLYFDGQLLGYYQQTASFSGAPSNSGPANYAYNFSFQLRWNLFDGGVSLARGQQASARSLQRQKEQEKAFLKVPYDFEYWKRKYLSSSNHYLARQLDVGRSQESLRLVREEQKAGARTLSQSLDAVVDLFRAKAGAVSAQLNAVDAKVHLELVTGHSI